MQVLEDSGRTPEDPSRAYAGATCAWALSNIVRSTGDSKAANTLLSVTEPPAHTVFSRILTHGFIDPDLCAESAWLLVHTLENVSASATVLACSGGIMQALGWCLEAAVADCGEDVQAKLFAMREQWVREGAHAWEQCVGQRGHGAMHAQHATPDQAMRDQAGMHDSDDDSCMEGSDANAPSSARTISFWPHVPQHQYTHSEGSFSDAPSSTRTLSFWPHVPQQQYMHAAAAGAQDGVKGSVSAPKWGLAVETSVAGTSNVQEHSLLATSQLSTHTLATSDEQGLEGGRDAIGSGATQDRQAGADSAGQAVAEGHSCVLSEGEQDIAQDSPIKSLV